MSPLVARTTCCRIHSRCLQHATQSNRKAPIRCPKPSSIASCSRFTSTTHRKAEELDIAMRTDAGLNLAVSRMTPRTSARVGNGCAHPDNRRRGAGSTLWRVCSRTGERKAPRGCDQRMRSAGLPREGTQALMLQTKGRAAVAAVKRRRM